MIKPIERALHLFGQWFMAMAFDVGGIFVMFGRIIKAMIPPRLDGPETWTNLYRVGVKSFPIVVVTAMFT
ncbi:MAG: hypothetical protein AAFS10_12635, partial [Myxococcota bacterium]